MHDTGYHSHYLTEFRQLSPEIIERELESGLLDFHNPSMRSKLEEALRLWRRDTLRFEDAQDRAGYVEASGWTKESPVVIGSPGSGLPGSVVLIDVLEYLAERLWDTPNLHSSNSKGKRLFPCITAPTKWHCSRQADWAWVRVGL